MAVTYVSQNDIIEALEASRENYYTIFDFECDQLIAVRNNNPVWRYECDRKMFFLNAGLNNKHLCWIYYNPTGTYATNSFDTYEADATGQYDIYVGNRQTIVNEAGFRFNRWIRYENDSVHYQEATITVPSIQAATKTYSNNVCYDFLTYIKLPVFNSVEHGGEWAAAVGIYINDPTQSNLNACAQVLRNYSLNPYVEPEPDPPTPPTPPTPTPGMGGFVRVSGYNEEDLERARQQGAGSVSLTPDHLGVSLIVAPPETGDQDNYVYKYYPSNASYTTEGCTVSWFWFYCTDNDENNAGKAKVEAITPTMSNYVNLIDSVVWGASIHSKGDSTFGKTPMRWASIKLPAGVRIRVGALAYRDPTSSTVVTAAAHAFIYSHTKNGIGLGIDADEIRGLKLTVAAGKELYYVVPSGTADPEAHSRDIARQVGITFVNYAQGITEFTTLEDIQVVINRARNLGIVLNANIVAGDIGDPSGGTLKPISETDPSTWNDVGVVDTGIIIE